MCYLGNHVTGMNVVVIGGGSVGCEVAEFIAPRHNYREVMAKKYQLLKCKIILIKQMEHITEII